MAGRQVPKSPGQQITTCSIPSIPYFLNPSIPSPRRGSALLAVLWLAAALAAIAFSLASTVRGEIERTSTALDGTREYYLATGALERTLLYMQWGRRYASPEGVSRYFNPWTRSLRFSFPTGDAIVEIIPETAKLNLNAVPPADLTRLLNALGAEPERAQSISAGIVDWRTPSREGTLTEFDRYYLSQVPSFRPVHASFQEIEELLIVRGMTPELFHGRLDRDPQGRLVQRTGLKDCVSILGSGLAVDANTAPLEVLEAVGLSAPEANAILQRRAAQPFRSIDQLRAMGLRAEASVRLLVGGAGMYTLRATARLRLADGKLSDSSRSAGATVVLAGSENDSGYRVVRWDDHPWVQDEQWTQERSSQ